MLHTWTSFLIECAFSSLALALADLWPWTASGLAHWRGYLVLVTHTHTVPEHCFPDKGNLGVDQTGLMMHHARLLTQMLGG